MRLRLATAVKVRLCNPLSRPEVELRLLSNGWTGEVCSTNRGQLRLRGFPVGNSPREITQRYQDVMACVVKYGKPSLFITVTCSPEWSEIRAALGPNDQACNRPDLIARLFEAKLHRLCDNVFGNKQRAGCFFPR